MLVDINSFILKEFSIQKKEGCQCKTLMSAGHWISPYLEKNMLSEPDDIIIELKVSPKSSIATREHIDFIHKVLLDAFGIC